MRAIPTIERMNKDPAPLATTVQAARLAIENNAQRGRLLSEMWEGLGLSPEVRDRVFRPGHDRLIQAAEQELLKEVERMRAAQRPAAEEGSRMRRPARMRGLMV